MTPFALSGLLILITSFCLAVFVLIKTPFIFSNRLWAYFNFAISIWGLGAYETGIAHDPVTALFWLKIAHIGVITIPLFFLHFLHYFLEQKNKKLIIGIYLTGAFFLIMLFSGHMISHVSFIFNSFYYATNPPPVYYIFFILWTGSVLYSYFLAYIKMRTTSGEIRNKIKYFFISLSVGYIGGITNFFPILGIHIYPYGNFLVAIFPIVMTIVILKYNLMDINIIIRKSLIYSLLVTTITLIFLVSVLVSQHLFNQVVHFQHVTTSIITACLIALIFTPLKNWIQDLVDRAFFNATTLEMAHQNELLRKEVTQSERMKSIAILASGLAHEIKNPLTTLKTFAEFVPLKKDDPEFMKLYQRIIPQEIDRIDNLVHELLFFAKPSPPQRQMINLNEIISNITLMLEQKFHSSKIKILLQLNTTTSLHADPNQVKQALLNIILNAFDAMTDGGTLTIASSGLVNKTGKYISIEITDTGCGITPQDLSHIFEPFFSKKEKGTGLGLAITKEIIEQHNGRIFVKSQLNKGTTFNLLLPVNYPS